MTAMTNPSSMTRTSGAFRTLLGMLAFHKGALALGIVFALLSSVGALLQPEVMNRIIAEVGHGSVTNLVLVLFAIMLVTAVASACQIFVLNRTAEAAVFQTRGRLIARMLRLPIARYDSMRTGDLVTRLGSDTTLIRSAFTGGLVDAIAGVVTMLGSIILMALIDVFLLSMVLLLVAGTVVIVVIASKKIQRYTKQLQKSVGLLGAGMDRALVAIRTIRAANAQKRVEDDLVAEAERAFGKGKETAKIEAFLYPVSGLALQASFLIVLGVGGARVSTGTIAVGDLVAFALYLFMLAMPLGEIFGAVTTIRSAMGAIERIQEVLDTPEESTAGDEAQLASSLSFDAIFFSYPSVKEVEGESVQPVARTEVLHDVSFQIPAGKVTAFVGPSGSGKSTTLALIQRFYDPDSGTIYLGEQNMSGLTRESVRRSIGYVEQEAAVLAGTVRDNLLLTRHDATDSECWDCLRQVGLEQRFRQAQGLDTLIGDRGMSLSGGQRQRLALARMLLMDAPILLLDEPTSAVDSRNEQLILDAIADSARGRTLVVVAHRLSTVIDADQIIVMEAGRVVAAGTHENLLQVSPLYRDLAHRQLLD